MSGSNSDSDVGMLVKSIAPVKDCVKPRRGREVGVTLARTCKQEDELDSGINLESQAHHFKMASSIKL